MFCCLASERIDGLTCERIDGFCKCELFYYKFYLQKVEEVFVLIMLFLHLQCFVTC